MNALTLCSVLYETLIEMVPALDSLQAKALVLQLAVCTWASLPVQILGDVSGAQCGPGSPFKCR